MLALGLNARDCSRDPCCTIPKVIRALVKPQTSQRSRQFSCCFEAVSGISAYDCGEACTFMVGHCSGLHDCHWLCLRHWPRGQLPRRKALKWSLENGRRLKKPFSHRLPSQYRLSLFYDGIGTDDSSPTKRKSRFLVAILFVLPSSCFRIHPQRPDTTGSRCETRGRHIGRERACTSLGISFGQPD